MIKRLLALTTACLAGSAMADTIGVRSGEHDTFTRLVFSMPEGTPWQLGRAGDGYGLRFESELAVSPEGVFRRIDRSRIAALRPVPGGVDLALACDCHADAFLYRPDALVVDIVNGAPDPGSDFELALAGEPVPAAARVPQPWSTLLPIVLPGQFPPGTGGPDMPPPTRLPAGPPALVEPPAGRDSAGVLAETEARLLESLAGAAAAGLLVLDPGARPEAAAPVAPATAPEPPPSEPQGPGIAARTGLGTYTPGQAAAAAPFCPPEDEFDVAAWLDPDERFDSGLARVRDTLTDEAGTPTPEGALGLARYYVAMGLGREALVTLDLADGDGREREPLAAMARLLDDKPDGTAFPVATPGCSGPVQLWSILIRGTTDGVAEDDLATAQRAFMLLPASLDGLIGPRFSRILTENGHALAADTIVSDLRRSNGVAQPEVALAEAGVALSLGGAEAAIESLSETAADPGRLSPEAVVQLIDLSLRGGIPVAEETLTLAATLRFEQRRTPAAGALARAEIRARLADDQFPQALQLIEDTAEELDLAGPGAAEALRADALAAFAERSDDDAFLDAAFRPLPNGAPERVRDLFAGRLEALGFPERADAVRSGFAAGGPAGPGLQAVDHAAPAAASSDPAVVADHASAASQPTQTTADQPEAEAGQDEQDPNPGPATATEAPPSDPPGGTGALSGAATAATAPAGADALPPLASRQRLLDDTAATRSMIEDLLSRYPSPAEPAE